MEAGTKVDMARLVLRGREQSLLPEGSRWYWLLRLRVGSDMIRLLFLMACFSYMAVRVVCGCPMILPLISMILLRGHLFTSLREPKDAEGEAGLMKELLND